MNRGQRHSTAATFLSRLLLLPAVVSSGFISTSTTTSTTSSSISNNNFMQLLVLPESIFLKSHRSISTIATNTRKRRIRYVNRNNVHDAVVVRSSETHLFLWPTASPPYYYYYHHLLSVRMSHDWNNMEDSSSPNSWEEQDTVDSTSIVMNGAQDEECDTGATAAACELHRWKKQLTEANGALSKKIRSLEREQEKATQVEDMVKRAQLITTYMYMFQPHTRSAVVQDWEQDGKDIEIVLNDKYKSASEEVDALFAQARKLKRGTTVIEDLLQQARSHLETLENIEQELNTLVITSPASNDWFAFQVIQQRLRNVAQQTGFQVPSSMDSDHPDQQSSLASAQQQKRGQRRPPLGTPASNIRKLISPGGCTVLVGRNRRGNEYLSMTLARGEDLWMHSRGLPGAHVLLQQRRGSPVATEACRQFAANLAIFYSDARTERRAPVTVAAPKHIQKPRNAPLGAVKIREELMTMVGCPDDVPVELKEARDESGQRNTEEYRSQDKAKRRRQTQKRIEEERSKKRSK